MQQQIYFFSYPNSFKDIVSLKFAPLLYIRTVTAKLQQVIILLGKNPIRMVLLSASSPKACASVYIAPKYAMVFLTDRFAGEYQ